VRSFPVDRHLLLLAAMLALAVVLERPLPGEETLPSLYRKTGLGPLLAEAGGGAGPEEAERLRAEAAALRKRVVDLEAELSATHELNGWFASLATGKRPLAIPARVFSREPDRFRRSFRIDRGSESGIEPGMPVVSGPCLLGVVASVEKGLSVVLRADDERFAVEVEIETGDGRPRAAGVARGMARGSRSGIRVEFVRRVEGLRPGRYAFTTDYDPRIPPGLLVGEVREVQDVDENQILDIALEPVVDLWRANLVEVLRARG
jgi:rod shape-determining protein MreC